MAFFGLKLGLDLKMRAAHLHQKFQGVQPRGGGHIAGKAVARLNSLKITSRAKKKT